MAGLTVQNKEGGATVSASSIRGRPRACLLSGNIPTAGRLRNSCPYRTLQHDLCSGRTCHTRPLSATATGLEGAFGGLAYLVPTAA